MYYHTLLNILEGPESILYSNQENYLEWMYWKIIRLNDLEFNLQRKGFCNERNRQQIEKRYSHKQVIMGDFMCHKTIVDFYKVWFPRGSIQNDEVLL